jgi:glutamate synthase (NADPH/NADH) large chain
MTGGVVYLLTDEELGLTPEAIKRRLAIGALVTLESVGEIDEKNLRELLGNYQKALIEGQQHAEAEEVGRLAEDWQVRFVKIVPARAKKPVPVYAPPVK